MINGNRTKSTRKRSPRDFYETPIGLAERSIIAFEQDEMFLYHNHNVLDPGCGTGVWGKAIQNIRLSRFPTVHGVDIESTNLSCFDGYSNVYVEDFLSYTGRMYHLAIGNPPYSLAEEFIRHAHELLYPSGYIFFLLRLSFLEGIKRGRGLFKDIPLKRLYVCSRRPSFFSSDGDKHTTDTLSYGMFLWQKWYRGEPTIKFLDWDYDK